MPKLLRYAVDLAALALLYALYLLPRWKRGGRRVLAVNTLMYLYLSGVLLVRLCRSSFRCPSASRIRIRPCIWCRLRMPCTGGAISFARSC